jgi:predicted phosphohydrolase
VTGPALWGLADLHLSHARPDPRDRFARRWADHAARIGEHWRALVGPGDIVLVPGDVSMAANHRDLQPDLAWLHALPGTKVLAPGNHDRWWNRREAIEKILRPSIRVVEGNAVAVPGLIVAGARSVAIADDAAPPEARTRQEAAVASARDALEAAARLRDAGEGPRVAMLWHHPPFDDRGTPGPLVPLLEAHGVDLCAFGHVHREGQWSSVRQGVVHGVHYACVAADAVGFAPYRLDRPPTRPRR